MLLVLLILATLAAIVVPKFAGRAQQAKETAAKTQISSFSTALDAFEVDMGYYPSTADSLQALQVEPKDPKSWRGPYLKQSVPKDPWGNDYTYEYPGKRNAGSYDLVSMGPDGRPGTDDDITNFGESGK
jgi:general secretion pathway protein G